MNKELFDYKIKVKNLSREEIAHMLSINPVTLYRKLTGDSDFTRNEIKILKDALNWTNEEVDSIFFTNKVA